jgi:hypothetical protein
MILKHNKDICSFDESQVFEDKVVTGVIKRVTPSHIYTQNQEFIDSFATALVNYSPISINIIDYWNKDIVDNSVIVPEKTVDAFIKIIHPFEFEESVPPVDEGYGLGFETNTIPSTGGSLVDLKGNFDESPKVGICPDEDKKRFWVNSLIGLQDRLAETHLNNFYSVLKTTTKDNIIAHRIYKILEDLDLDTEGLFDNTNTLFTEERYLANRHFNTKKGTAAAIRYVSQSAIDANMQGKAPLGGDYYMRISEEAPFEYSVESNMLGVLFERFVKPLAHPIGMIYQYRTVCVSEVANQTEYPLVEFDYSNMTIGVECLCWMSGEENNPLPPQPGDPDAPDIECVFGTYPEQKVFATPDGTGLWEGISIDEGTGNIPKEFEEGIAYDTANPGNNIPLEYKKWTFENGNILIQFTKEPYVNDTARSVLIEYYRYDDTADDYILAANFINQRHCNIATSGEPIRRSYVKETLTGDCTDIMYGMFELQPEGTIIPPETPGNSGMYEGFWVDLDDDQQPDQPPLGGVLNQYTDLYHGYFQFLGKDEINDYQIGEWPETGLTEGYSESMIYDQTDFDPTNPENPHDTIEELPYPEDYDPETDGPIYLYDPSWDNPDNVTPPDEITPENIGLEEFKITNDPRSMGINKASLSSIKMF